MVSGQCPRGKLPPQTITPGHLPPDDWPQIITPWTIALEEYCPPDNCPQDDCPWLIAPGQLLQR